MWLRVLILQRYVFIPNRSASSHLKSCAVVTPGAILLALLKNSGMPDVTIGTWRGLMAGSGALGTFLAPWLLKRKGIMASAKITIIGMQTAITCAAVLYILRNALPDFEQFPTYHGLQFFLVPVTFSRMFLYAYDLVEVQVTPLLFARVRARFQICNSMRTRSLFVASSTCREYN
jgi:hypothetical protein